MMIFPVRAPVHCIAQAQEKLYATNFRARLHRTNMGYEIVSHVWKVKLAGASFFVAVCLNFLARNDENWNLNLKI